MNNFFKKLFKTKNFFAITHHYSADKGLVAIAEAKRKLANVCLIDRSEYWYTKKHYRNVNIIDIRKLVQAEIKQLSPFEGKVLWRIDELSLEFAIVSYFVVPRHVIDEITVSCQFIFPELKGKNYYSLLNEFNDVEQGESTLSARCITAEDSHVLALSGMFVKKAKDKSSVSQKLTTKRLLIMSMASIALFVIVSSGYLSLTQSYYQDATANNKEAVERALKVQRELKLKKQSKQEFEQFLSENQNVLALFSSLDLTGHKYEINRVHLHPKGIKITGTTSQSATDILARLIQEPVVKEAKFSRPVSKNRSGGETFVIEVTFQ